MPASTEAQTVPDVGITEGLARLRRSSKIISRIPKSVRPLVADSLCATLDSALRHQTIQAWWRFFSFAFFSLRAPGKGDVGITAAANIRRQLSGTSPTQFHRTSSYDPPDNAARGEQHQDSDDTLARRVRGKCADGDIRAALRLLTSDDAVAEPDPDVIASLKQKHPAAPEDDQLPPSPSPSDPAPLTVTSAELEAAINSMPPGSSAGLDGIRPLHLRQLISSDAAECGRRLLQSLTALTNLVLAGRMSDCRREALFGASLFALRKKSGVLRPIAVGSV